MGQCLPLFAFKFTILTLYSVYPKCVLSIFGQSVVFNCTEQKILPFALAFAFSFQTIFSKQKNWIRCVHCLPFLFLSLFLSSSLCEYLGSGRLFFWTRIKFHQWWITTTKLWHRCRSNLIHFQHTHTFGLIQYYWISSFFAWFLIKIKFITNFSLTFYLTLCKIFFFSNFMHILLSFLCTISGLFCLFVNSYFVIKAFINLFSSLFWVKLYVFIAQTYFVQHFKWEKPHSEMIKSKIWLRKIESLKDAKTTGVHLLN